jgi:hypothetical protein
MSLGKTHSWSPSLTISLWIDIDRQKSKVAEGSVAEGGIMPTTAHSHFKDISYFQPPQRGDPCSVLDDPRFNIGSSGGRFLAVDPGDGN